MSDGRELALNPRGLLCRFTASSALLTLIVIPALYAAVKTWQLRLCRT